MNRSRLPAVAALVFAALPLAACGTSTGDVVAPRSDAGAPGALAPRSPDAAGATSGDSSRLRVDVQIAVVADVGASAETATVRVLVYVTDVSTHAPVVDATLTAGPVGHAVPLAFNEPLTYSAEDHYGGVLTGYDAAWELSVVRGSEFFEGVRFVGPSFPSVALLADAGAVTVAWSPAGEPNVTTSVCLWGAMSGAAGAGEGVHQGWCAQGGDEGSILLSAADQVPWGPTVPAPTPGAVYDTQFVESLEGVTVGALGGTASFAIAVDSEQAVRPRVCGATNPSAQTLPGAARRP